MEVLFVFYSTPCLGSTYGAFDINVHEKTYLYLQSNQKVRGNRNIFIETAMDVLGKKKLHRQVTFDFSLRLQIDSDQKSQGVTSNLKDNDRKRNIVDLNEGFIEYRQNNFDWFLGKRIHSWGKGDYFHPSDRINPQDYTDFLDTEKMGVFSFGMKYYPNVISQLEIQFLPFFTKSRLYFTNSSWSIFDREVKIEEKIPSDAQYALRYSLYLENWDIEMIYIKKREDLPTLFFNDFKQIVTKYKRANIFSLEQATTIANRFELHGGLTYYDNDEPQVYGKFVNYLIGLNYSFNENIFFKKNIDISSEFLGTIDIKKPDEDKVDKIVGDFFRLFENSLFLKICFSVGNFSLIEVSNLFLLEQSSNDILRVAYRHNYNDQLELKLGVDCIWGNNKEPIFYRFSKNDRIFFKVKYIFN